MKKNALVFSSFAAFACMAESLVFAPGDGVTTNVAERINGAYDSLVVNEGASGGGVVKLSNEWSFFTGAPVVNCGTLEIGTLRAIGYPSALGRGTAGDTITVRDGTFRYAGAPATTDRNLTLAPSNGVSVLSVADGTSLTVGGKFTLADGKFVKTGGGTLTLKQLAGTSNQFAHAAGVVSVPFALPANGDAPASGKCAALTVADGRLVIDCANSVTNYFYPAGTNASGKSWREAVNDCQLAVGLKTTSEPNAEKTGHLEIRGGVNKFPYCVYVGCQNATEQTSAETLHPSLDIYGGVVDMGYNVTSYLYLGTPAGKTNNNSVAHLNVYGGELKLEYLRVGDYLGNRSKTFISGGTVTCYGVYPGQWTDGPKTWDDPDAAYVPQAEIHVCSNGTLFVQGGTFYMARDSLVDQTVRVTDGGTLIFAGFTHPANATLKANGTARTTLVVDGGVLDTHYAAKTCLIPGGVTTKIGAGGVTWNNCNCTLNWFGPIGTLDGAGEDGGIAFSGSGTANLFGATDFNGPLSFSGTGTLVVSNAVGAGCVSTWGGAWLQAAPCGATLKNLAHPDGLAKFKFSQSGGVASKFTLAAWKPPASGSVSLVGTFPVGEYALVDFPASVAADAARFVCVDSASGVTRSFKITQSGDVKTLVLVVESASSSAGVDLSYAAPSTDGETKAFDSDVVAKSLAFPNAPGWKLAGSGSIVLDAGGSTVKVTDAGGATNRVDVPVTANGQIVLDVPPGGRLEFASISGVGNLTATCSQQGGSNGYGGAVHVDDLSGFHGGVVFNSGLIEVDKFPELLQSLFVGYGEFRYLGKDDAHMTYPLTLTDNSYATTKLCVKDAAATLYLDGPVSQSKGTFWKTGAGTLDFSGAYDYELATTWANYGDFNYDTPAAWSFMVDGTWTWRWMYDSCGRTRSGKGFGVAGGTVRWGKDGQTMNVGSSSGGIAVGFYSTATPGGELDATLRIEGGETVVNGDVAVSANHGNSYFNTASHSVLTARVEMAGGTLSARKLLMGDNWQYAASRAEWIQTGGDVSLSGAAHVGLRGVNGGGQLFELRGGRFSAATLMRFGEYDSVASSEVNLRGGVLDVPTLEATYGKHSVNLFEGGTLRVWRIALGKNALNADGGTIKFVAAEKTGNSSSPIVVGENGLTVDLSDQTSNLAYMIGRVSGGKVTVRRDGECALGALIFSDGYAHDFSELDVVAGGTAGGSKQALSNVVVKVASGCAFGPNWTSMSGVCAETKSLEFADGAILQLNVSVPQYSVFYASPVKARESFSAAGKVYVRFADSSCAAAVAPPAGSYAILVAPKGTIDGSKFELAGASTYGEAAFEVVSRDADYDQLVVTFTGSASGHVWTTDGDGAWGEAANWSVAPNGSANDLVTFPATLSVDAQVDLGGERAVGTVEQKAERKVTLAGGSLAFGASAAVNTVSNGTLALPPVSAPNAVKVNETRGAGRVEIDAAQPAQDFTVSSGTLAGDCAAFGGKTVVKNCTLALSGVGVVDGKISDNAENMTLRVEKGCEAWIMEDLDCQGIFVKSGAGTAYLAGSGKSNVGRASSGIVDKATPPAFMPSNGDMVTTGLEYCNVIAGKLVVGLNPSQTVSIGGRFHVGGPCRAEVDENGNVIDSEIEVLGGTLDGGDLNLLRNPGLYSTKYKGKPRHAKFTVRGGTVKCGGLYTVHDNPGKLPGGSTAEISVYDGSLSFSGGYVMYGYHDCNSKTTVNVFGGTYAHTVKSWAINPIGSGAVDFNFCGGEFSTVDKFRLHGKAVNLNFAGGTMKVPCVYPANNNPHSLLWDGGTLKPTSNDCALVCTSRAWTTNECRAGGAKFDLSAAGANAQFSLNQTFTHDERLGAEEDGGIEMLGGGTLTLDAPNTMNGAVKVSGGVVKCNDAAAVSGGVVVNGDGVLDLNGQLVTASYLRGNGGTVAGGTLSVAGAIAPSTFVTVAGIACGADARLVCPLTEGEDGSFTTTLVKVAANGAVTSPDALDVDFLLGDDDMLPKNFAVKIAELGDGATFTARLHAVKTGRQRHWLAAETRGSDVWAVLHGPGTAVIIR